MAAMARPVDSGGWSKVKFTARGPDEKEVKVQVVAWPRSADSSGGQKPVGAAPTAKPPEAKAPETLRLKLKVEDEDGHPHVSCPFEIKVGSDVIKGTTTPEGVVDAQVPRAKQAELTIHGHAATQRFTLQMGALAPATGVLGAQERLESIGYSCHPTGALDDETKAAIGGFQKDHKLPVTGALSAATAKS